MAPIVTDDMLCAPSQLVKKIRNMLIAARMVMIMALFMECNIEKTSAGKRVWPRPNSSFEKIVPVKNSKIIFSE